jgi:hypothetical protein
MYTSDQGKSGHIHVNATMLKWVDVMKIDEQDMSALRSGAGSLFKGFPVLWPKGYIVGC